MKEKETKKNLDELEDRRIGEEMLEEVSGGVDSEDLEELLKHSNAKRYKGSLLSSMKK